MIVAPKAMNQEQYIFHRGVMMKVQINAKDYDTRYLNA
jgi:hypothetical protein